MKHVHKESMVAHLWANKSQDNARNSRNTFYFTERTIYSYGSHFPIAAHVTVGRGASARSCILFTTQEHSVTTEGHKGTVRMAIRGDTPVFNVVDVNYSMDSDRKYAAIRNKRMHADNVAGYRERINTAAKKSLKARANKQAYIKQAMYLANEAKQYAAFFKLRAVFVVPTVAEMKAQTEKEAAAAKIAEKKWAARRAARLVFAMERLEEWKAGRDVYTGNLHLIEKVYLRVVHPIQEEDVLETSKGAKVPLRHAIRLLPMIRCGHEYKRNGHSEHVGKFVVDHITADGNVKIGCHFVERDEIERIAAQLGL